MITADKENRFSRFPTWTSSGLREEIAETPVRVVPRRVEDTGDGETVAQEGLARRKGRGTERANGQWPLVTDGLRGQSAQEDKCMVQVKNQLLGPTRWFSR